MTKDRAPPASRSSMRTEAIDLASLREIVDIDPASLQKIVAAIKAAEWALRSEQTRAGIAAARQRGQRLGRRPALTESQIALARRMMVEGASKKRIARTLRVSPSTVRLVLKPYAGEAPQKPQKPKKLKSPPPVRSCLMTESNISLARRMLAAGVTRKLIARELKVSSTTLYLALKPYSAGPFPQMLRAQKNGRPRKAHAPEARRTAREVIR